jgi:DNA-binding response OmpR family regulator
MAGKNTIPGSVMGEGMPKIMIVDDEASIRMLYREEFEDEHYDVVEAEDGLGLVARVEEERPDIMVLDIKMADYDGLDLLQEVRQRFHDLPIIISSAYGAYKGDYKTLAADYYVVKSSDLSELKQKVKKALEGRVPAKAKGE